jgi:hypothetical protein
MDKLVSIVSLVKDMCNDIVSPYKNSTVNDVLKDDKINNNVEKSAKIFVVASGNIAINTIISSIDLIKYCIINANTLYKNSSDNIETFNKAVNNMMEYIKYNELFNNLKLDVYEDIKQRTLSTIDESDESEDEVKDNEDEVKDNEDEVKDNEDEDEVKDNDDEVKDNDDEVKDNDNDNEDEVKDNEDNEDDSIAELIPLVRQSAGGDTTVEDDEDNEVEDNEVKDEDNNVEDNEQKI